MKMLRKQPGASLLIILLIMAGAGSVVLVGSRALIDSSRQVGATTNNTVALQMAQAGTQDGLLLYKKGFLTSTGEYGDSAGVSGYSLKPVRRGFTDAACKSWGVDQPATSAVSTYSLDCPYYDIAIRNTKALTASTTDYSLTSRELPNNVPTIIPIPVNPAITVNLNSVPGFTYDYYLCVTLDCTDVTDPVQTFVAQNNLSFQIPATAGIKVVKAMKFTSHFTLSSGPHVIIVSGIAPQSGWPSQIAMGKGYTTVDVTGYAGGVQKKVLLTIRNHDKLDLAAAEINPSYNELDFAGSFDQYGILIP
jgi:hypothetical protein